MAENHQEKGNSEPTNTKIEATIQYLYGCTGRYRQTQCFLFTIVLYLLYLHTYTNHACVDIKIYKEPRSSYTPPSHKSIYTIYTGFLNKWFVLTISGHIKIAWPIAPQDSPLDGACTVALKRSWLMLTAKNWNSRFTKGYKICMYIYIYTLR